MHRSGWTVDERAQYVAFGYKQSYDECYFTVAKRTCIGP